MLTQILPSLFIEIIIEKLNPLCVHFAIVASVPFEYFVCEATCVTTFELDFFMKKVTFIITIQCTAAAT